MKLVHVERHLEIKEICNERVGLFPADARRKKNIKIFFFVRTVFFYCSKNVILTFSVCLVAAFPFVRKVFSGGMP